MHYQFLVIVLLQAAVVAAQGTPGVTYGEPLPLFYDMYTGNATIDLTNVFGGASAGYSLVIPCDNECDAFRPENHTSLSDSVFVTATTKTIAESNFGNIPAGVYSLGSIFPVGMTEQELVNTYFTPEPVFDRIRYNVLGSLGSGIQHALEPILAATPFETLNDSTVGLSSAATAWASQVILGYDASNGDLSLRSDSENGGAIFSYEIQFSSDVAISEFAPIHRIGLGSAKTTETRILEIGWEGIPSGVYSLGSILPPGLSETELDSLVESARFLGQPGHSVSSLDVTLSGIDMSLSLVPEPPCCTHLSMLLLATLIAGRRNVR